MLLWNIFSDLTLKRKANKHIVHQNINLSFRNIFRHVDIYTQPIANGQDNLLKFRLRVIRMENKGDLSDSEHSMDVSTG